MRRRERGVADVVKGQGQRGKEGKGGKAPIISPAPD